MFDQLTQLVQQYGNEAVVKNNAVPNEHNENVMNEAGNSIFSGLQKMASEGGVEQLAGLFHGDSSIDSNNPVVKQLSNQMITNLGEKFGLNSNVTSGIAGSMIPKILSSLVGKAKDPNDSSFEISDLIKSISGNETQASGIMDAITKYGAQFGLDQNGDGKVDLNDAAAISKNGGLGSVLGKLFGK